jgi:hypothetical protein
MGQGGHMEWWATFNLLAMHVAKHRRIPRRAELGRWARNQCMDRHTLTAAQQLSLESLEGWRWDAYKSSWEMNFAVLVAYVNQHRRLPAQSAVIEGIKLGRWVCKQRVAKRGQERRAISPGQIQALESLECWDWGREHDDTAAVSRAGQPRRRTRAGQPRRRTQGDGKRSTSDFERA